MKLKTSPKAPTTAAAPAAAGGATIADRFKLDAPAADAKKQSAGGGVASLVALIAAVIALGVAGMLVYLLYGHWGFLQFA